MVIFCILDIVVPFLMIGEVYSIDASTPFCNQSTETQPNPCCICPANTSCHLTCPMEWKKIRGNEVQCPYQNINPDKLYTSIDYDYDDYYTGMNPDDNESSLTPIGTFTLDNNTYFVYCVAECPVRTFYEHRDLKCHPCDPSCKACDGPNATECTACEFETDDGCMKECPQGWEPIPGRKGPRRGTVCKIRININDGRPKLIEILGYVAGAVAALIVVILVCCVCYRCRTGNCVQTQNKRANPKRYVRGENDIDAAGFTDEMQPFTTGNTEDANFHLYHEIEDKTTEVKYDYAYAEREGDRKKPTESEKGCEPIEGDFEDVTHNLHVDEDIYEEIGEPRTCQSATPRARQEPYLTPVAECAEINIGKQELGVSNASDIRNSDKDRKCVVENPINTAGILNKEPLTVGDVCKTAAHPNEDNLVPISGTANSASRSGTIDNINSNVDITQIKTEPTREGIMDDGTVCEFYIIATDNKGGPTDSVAAAGKISDSAKQLHFPMIGLKLASNKNEVKRGNFKSDDITDRKPKLKPKPLPKPNMKPRVASEISFKPAVKPVSETEIRTDFDVIPKPRHFKPVPLPRKQMTSSDGTVQGDKQMTKQFHGQGKKAIPKDVSDFYKHDIKKTQSCKTELPVRPNTALSDVFEDKFQHTGHYTDVLSIDDLKDASKYNREHEEPSSEIDPSDISLPKVVSLSFSEEEIKQILGDTNKSFFE